jgi:tetratricopeptide (TPR) repeat protein
MPGAWRTVRVFISSTFKDMQEERDYLVKQVFPELRKRCRERAVEFVEVDLRWGVTEEQANRGEVLPICLREIELCRPYFIGLLGERYGWMPDRIDPQLLEEQPWLAEHREQSVTALEIVHGVLNNPEMAQRSYFYFRDPAYIDNLPEDRRRDFLSEDPEAQAKLAKLKERIWSSGLPLKENYPDPEAVGQWILEDLWQAIDQEYPAGEVPGPLAREAAEHEAFALSRAKMYIGRQEYFACLDEHLKGDDQPLIILGESGAGKSALLANWAFHFQKQHSQELLVLHFIGATASGTDWQAMLRRIMGELRERFQILEEIPEKPDELRLAFANWLSMAAARGRVVLVLDALNQLEDKDGAPDLVWLPPVIPGKVSLILSTLPGRPLEELERRYWLKNTLTIDPLTPEERQAFIPHYLKQYSKELSPDLAARVAAAPQTANPLYLRTLLEELRVFGDHHTLKERLAFYLEASTPDQLYGKVLGRWEEDYERSRPGLVRDAMTLIWASRRGLSEAELLEVLGTDGKSLPHAHWSPLFLAAEASLVNRAGFLGFFHAYLRQAVKYRYLSDLEGQPFPEAQQAAHLRLADYFQSQDLNTRQIDELPWHLSHAKEWDHLHDLLTIPDFLSKAWKDNKYDIKEYWTCLEQQTPYRIIDAYRQCLEHPENYMPIVNAINSLLEGSGYWNEVINFRENLYKHYQRVNDVKELAFNLYDLARVLTKQGNFNRALSLYNEGMELIHDLDLKDILLSYLIGMAIICQEREELGPALALLMEGEAISREMGSRKGLMECLQKQISVFRSLADYDMALSLLEQIQNAALESGDLDAYQAVLGERALLMDLMGRREEGMSLLQKQETMCRRLGNIQGLAECLGSQGSMHFKNQDTESAENLYRQQEEIAMKLGNQRLMYTSHLNLAKVFLIYGDLTKAQELLEPAIGFFESKGMTHQLGQSLKVKGLIKAVRGEFANATGTLISADLIGSHVKSPMARVLPQKDSNYSEFASKYLQRTFQRDLSDADTSCRLGRVLEYLGLTDKAVQVYRQALNLHPQLTDVQFRLASLIIDKRATKKLVMGWKEETRKR